jgi:hypothetical protein
MTRHKNLALCAAAIALALTATSVALAQDTAAPVVTPAEPAQTETAPPAADAPAAEAAPAAPAEPVAPPAPAGPPSIIPPPAAGKGQVVFFRPSRFAGGALTFTVREGETDLGRLGSGRYFVHAAEPGIHEYVIGRNDTLRLEIEEGATYYMQNNIAMGIMAGRGVLAPSDQATFEGMFDDLRLYEPSN